MWVLFFACLRKVRPLAPREAEKWISRDLARGATRVNFVLFPFPLGNTHLMVSLKLPYERQVSKISIYFRTRRNKKSDSLLFQRNVVHIRLPRLGVSHPCVGVLGKPRVFRDDHGNHSQLKGAHTTKTP